MLKQEGNGLRVFEVLAGCGIRSKRYLQQVPCRGLLVLLLGTLNAVPSALPAKFDAALVSSMCKLL